jgi:carbonic anhydrase
MIFVGLLTTMATFIVTAKELFYENEWGYLPPYKYLPHEWYKIPQYSKCAGYLQSPINIEDAKAVHDYRLKSLMFSKINLDQNDHQIWEISSENFKSKTFCNFYFSIL